MAKKPADPWHFPRTDLAGTYLDTLDSGISNRLTLFATRRMGKTEFLIYDLAPAADKRKYRTVYASCWENVDAPHLALIDALHSTVTAVTKRRSIARSVLGAAVKRAKVDSLFGLGAEVEFASAPQAATTHDLQRMRRLATALSKGRHTKVLLLIDEIQHLGTDNAFRPLVHTLRTILDELRQVRVVFTGSSRAGVRAMFHAHDAPFFEFSDFLQLPAFGREFVRHQVRTFKAISKRTVNEKQLWEVFQKVDFSPYYLRNILKAMVLDPHIDIAEAYDYVLEGIAIKRDYALTWNALRPLERAVLLAALDQKPIYADSQIGQYRKQLKTKKISTHQVQYAVKKLVTQQLITPVERGKFISEVPGFEDWILRELSQRQ